MLTYDTSLASILNGASNKLTWISALNTAMGNARQVRAFHDSNASTLDPFTTGIEFLKVGASGAITGQAGVIISLGILSGVTIKTATDLTTGAAILRIEGNGHWVQGTLGAAGSTCDFILNGSLTASAGVAFSPKLQVKPPRLLPSGTGPAAPPIKTTTPTIIELVDWTDPNAPTVVGIATFSQANRLDDWVFESVEMAAEIGDVAMYVVDNPIVWNTRGANVAFELGGLLMIAANYNTLSGTIQLEQMLLSFVPHARWASYPAMDTFNKAAYPVVDSTTYPVTYGPCSNTSTYDSTYPPPFKINLKQADGTIVFTHEMKAFNDKPAGPINGPQYSQSWTSAEPLIPHFNCAMMLPWQNTNTKQNANGKKYHAGVTPFSYTGRIAKEGPCSNACIPLVDAAYQMMGHNHWYVSAPYPLRDAAYSNSADKPYLTSYTSMPQDPDAFPGDYTRDHYHNVLVTGYKYQPGSISGHDWKSGNGGVRYDRVPCPTPYTIFQSNQNWLRPEGNTPIRDLVDNWGLAYFNHSNHWIRNLRTFESLPKQGIINGDWVFASAYYGGGPYGTAGQSMGPQDTIDLQTPGNAGSRLAIHNDGSGRMPYGGWQRDALHSYCNAAWHTILLNSPMHAIAAVHDFNTQWISGLGTGSRATSNPTGFFMVRVQAWRWLAYALQWKVASQHPLSYSRQEVEDRFQIELELMYDTIMKPAFIDNSTGAYHTCVRNLGIGLDPTSYNNHAGVDANGNDIMTPVSQSYGGSLGLYIVHTIVLMRQLGLWSVMKQKSAKCKFTLEQMIVCLDNMVVNYILNTDMRDSFYPVIAFKASPTGADIPANWAAQKVMLDTTLPVCTDLTTPFNTAIYHYDDRQFYKNFTLRYDNNYGEQNGNPHMFMQYLKARKVFFSEYPNANIDSAITKMQGYYDAFEAGKASGKSLAWSNYYPSHGELLTPPVIGPN